MIKRKQLYRHQPHNDIWGDCFRTALGCLLDLEPWQVPHFANLCATVPGYDWRLETVKWLATQGYGQAEFLYDDLDKALSFMDAWNPNLFYLLHGRSPRDTGHTVICRGGSFYWDPAKDGGFLVGPMDHGLYELTVLVPLSMID